MKKDTLSRLEELVDELLGRLKSLEEERDRWTMERETLLSEQQRIRAELDRILTKLEGWEQGLA